MQTRIHQQFKDGEDIAEADEILRSCVHCGFCTATCPTYQILGNELDSPRGRIYLIKDMLESGEASNKTREHLDRCLGCRSCETTCPSGVRYHRLLDIGRRVLDQKSPRPLSGELIRVAMCYVLPHEKRLALALKTGHVFKPLLPRQLKNKLLVLRSKIVRPKTYHTRCMLVLEGCVQPLTTPNTNAAASRVLDRLGILLESVNKAGCCGAINQHMSDPDQAKQYMRNNIDAWWPHVNKGLDERIEAIVMTASGCGLMIKEYGQELRDDLRYAAKAAKISELARDISEIIRAKDLTALVGIGQGKKVAYQSSCTSQYGQKLSGVVESILKDCGYGLTEVVDSHLCCGAAGTYTLLQPELS